MHLSTNSYFYQNNTLSGNKTVSSNPNFQGGIAGSLKTEIKNACNREISKLDTSDPMYIELAKTIKANWQNALILLKQYSKKLLPLTVITAEKYPTFEKDNHGDDILNIVVELKNRLYGEVDRKDCVLDKESRHETSWEVQNMYGATFIRYTRWYVPLSEFTPNGSDFYKAVKQLTNKKYDPTLLTNSAYNWTIEGWSNMTLKLGIRQAKQWLQKNPEDKILLENLIARLQTELNKRQAIKKAMW